MAHSVENNVFLDRMVSGHV